MYIAVRSVRNLTDLYKPSRIKPRDLNSKLPMKTLPLIFHSLSKDRLNDRASCSTSKLFSNDIYSIDLTPCVLFVSLQSYLRSLKILDYEKEKVHTLLITLHIHRRFINYR